MGSELHETRRDYLHRRQSEPVREEFGQQGVERLPKRHPNASADMLGLEDRWDLHLPQKLKLSFIMTSPQMRRRP